MIDRPVAFPATSSFSPAGTFPKKTSSIPGAWNVFRGFILRYYQLDSLASRLRGLHLTTTLALVRPETC